MLVERLLPTAKKRLVTIGMDATVAQAARLLAPGTDILVVCNTNNALAGVITKTDIVRQIGRCQGSTCTIALSKTMSGNVLYCRAHDRLPDVWSRTRARCLKNIPFVDDDLHPIGLLNLGDMLQALLKESKDEEAMMRDYILGIGYR